MIAVTRSYPMNDHLKRYDLENGWFIDRERLTTMQRWREHPYELWAPAMPCARFLGAYRTLALAIMDATAKAA